MNVTIPGKPVPCPRPRVGKHGTYYPDNYKAWHETASVLMRDAAVRQNGGRLYEGPVRVTCRFYGAHKGADLDNLVKSVFDAANGMVFRDDRQVVELGAVKCGVPDGETAHTEVTIEELTAQRGP